MPFHEIAIHAFPDGEMRVTVGPASATTIIYASLDRPNDKLIALMFAAEALRRGGAKRLVLVAPYLCYMRQDTAFHEGEAISQKVIGPFLARYIDRVITVDAHLHRTPDIEARISRHPSRQSLGHAGHIRHAAAEPVLIQRQSWRDRMRNPCPGSAISPAGSACPIPLRERPVAAIVRSRSSFQDPDVASPAAPP